MKLVKKIFVLSTTLSTLCFVSQAQTIIPEEAIIVSPEDTLVIEDQASPVIEAYIPTADANAVREGLRHLSRTMPLEYNSTVHSFVDFFIYKKPSFTKTMLERKNFYFPIFEKYLAKHGMPEELKYLSMIESGLNPKAISRSKAVGLWQFMKPTGREFGLRIDDYVDERMDIEKSTEAACKYLKQLYRIFGDWELALASYNTGPGNVRRAIRKSGNITNYWQLHPYLHRDTRSYVPQFTAIIYMMHHSDEYGILAEETLNPVETESIYVNGFLDIETFSNLSGITIDEIQMLNPQILKAYLPESTRDFVLRIPAEKYAYYEANRQMILDSAQRYKVPPYLLANNSSNQPESGVIVIGENYSTREEAEDTDKPAKIDEDVKKIRSVKKKIHVVKRGEVLNRIADKYDVEMYDIRSWNKMKTSKILVGQRLTIYLDNDNDEVAEVARTIRAERKTKREIENNKPKYVKVQSGDTLWSISQRYGGISVEKIKKMNGLKSNKVKAGQKLKIA
jgi:membrane-bound lytic murein transglycosylase D